MHSAALQAEPRHHAIAAAEDRWVGMAEVCRRTDRHRATIYRMIADGDFPAGSLRRNRRNWWLSDVLAWMDQEPN